MPYCPLAPEWTPFPAPDTNWHSTRHSMRSYHILSLTLLCCSAFLGTQRVSAAPAPAPGRSGSSAAASDGIGRLRITSNSLSCTSSSLLETADGDTPRGRFRADRISINWDRLNIRGDANMSQWAPRLAQPLTGSQCTDD